MRVYHGTNQGNFFVFDWDKTQRADGGFYGRGHYFTSVKSMAEEYGKRIVDGYVNIENPFVWSEEVNSYNGRQLRNISARNFASRINLARVFPDLFANKQMDYVESWSASGDPVIKSIKWSDLEKEINKTINSMKPTYFADGTIRWSYPGKYWDEIVGDRYSSIDEAEDNKFEAGVQAFIDTHDGISRYMTFDDQTTFTQDYGSEISESLKKMGYDGAMQTRDGEEIVVFDSKQFKEATNKNPTSRDDIRFQRKEYWVPKMSKQDRSTIDHYIEKEKHGDNSIDGYSKWMYHEVKGEKYFAIYSTAHIDDPTLLYASLGDNAEYEMETITRYIEEYKNGIRDGEVLSSWVASYGVRYANSTSNRGYTGNRRTADRNDGLDDKTSKRKFSTAFANCISNLSKFRDEQLKSNTGEEQTGQAQFQLRDNARSDVDILSEAFDDSAKTATEKRALKDFKAQVEKYHNAEADLEDAQAILDGAKRFKSKDLRTIFDKFTKEALFRANMSPTDPVSRDELYSMFEDLANNINLARDGTEEEFEEIVQMAENISHVMLSNAGVKTLHEENSTYELVSDFTKGTTRMDILSARKVNRWNAVKYSAIFQKNTASCRNIPSMRVLPQSSVIPIPGSGSASS